MIRIVAHEYCNDCPLFEARSLSELDYSVEGYTKHFVSLMSLQELMFCQECQKIIMVVMQKAR